MNIPMPILLSLILTFTASVRLSASEVIELSGIWDFRGELELAADAGDWPCLPAASAAVAARTVWTRHLEPHARGLAVGGAGCGAGRRGADAID